MRLLLLGMLVACGTKRPQVAPDAPPDAVPDAYVDPCDVCTTDQLCVQLFDGVCDPPITTCVPRVAACHDPSLTENACSMACNDAYCGSPYLCTDRLGCGPTKPQPSPKAFTCYGP